MADEPRSAAGDDRPSEAVLDELLRAFAADDPSAGAEIDLDSPEVEALLTGEVSRPTVNGNGTNGDAPSTQVDDADSQDRDEVDSEVGEARSDEAEADGEGEAAVGSAGDDLEHEQPSADESAGGEVGDATPAEGVAEASHQPVIKISADDEPPDAVYVEGELDASGGGATTVFIDDGAGDIGEIVGSAEAARATGIEPKLRERRIAVRRAEGRKRLRWVVLAVAVLLVLVAALAVLGSSLFAVENVKLSGAVNSRGEALDAIVDDLEGQAVLRIDTGEYERRIEDIPWVERARVSARFPSSARIEIAERQAVAAFQGADGKFRVIDREGRVLDVLAGQPVEYLLVSTDSPPNTKAGDWAPAGFGAAGDLALVLTPTVRPLVDSIVVAADGSDVRLSLEGGTEVLLGDSELLTDKLVRLETVIDDDPGNLPQSIDVSSDEVTTSPD